MAGDGVTPPQRMASTKGAVPVHPRPAARRQYPMSKPKNSESYFQAAFEILAEQGADGITVTNLCDRLDVTKGSFYYHFYGVADFVDAFADYWETSVATLLAVHGGDPDPLRRMSGVITALANLSHEAEAALRAWGHSNPTIGRVQARMDRTLEQLVTDTVSAFIDDSDVIALVAHQAVGLVIGLQHREHPIDRVRYLRALASLAEMTCGVKASISVAAAGPAVEFARI